MTIVKEPEDYRQIPSKSYTRCMGRISTWNTPAAAFVRFQKSGKTISKIVKLKF